jgi:multidrug efflux pump subunit AcrA (membrane-fusion protein)
MFGEAQLTIAKKTGVLTVPQSAVRNEAGTAYVYAIENGKLAQKPVTLGMNGDDGEGNAVEVLAGLDNGVRVVKINLGSLQVGSSVRFTGAGSAGAPAPSSVAVQ